MAAAGAGRTGLAGVYPVLVTSFPIAALDNPVDLLLLLVVALLIFGKDLPQVARTLGKGIRDLKESVNLGEMGDAINSIHEVRNAVSPTALMRAIPGVAEFQDGTEAARDALDPQSAVPRVAYPLPSPEVAADVAPPTPEGSAALSAPGEQETGSSSEAPVTPADSSAPEAAAPAAPEAAAPTSSEASPALLDAQPSEPPPGE